MGDKIAIFKEGRLVQYDRPEVLLTQPKDDYIADFVGADRALKVLGILRAEDAMNTDERYVLKSTAGTAEARECLGDRDVDHCVVVKDDKPYGYITGEILKEAKEGELRDVAESYPVLLDAKTTLRDVLSQMLMNDMEMLTVADEDGKYAGVITFRDIQRELLEGFREPENEGG
jgi:osmoprotectant transport system ATP-binding protein